MMFASSWRYGDIEGSVEDLELNFEMYLIITEWGREHSP